FQLHMLSANVRERECILDPLVPKGFLQNYYRDGNDSVACHADKDTLSGLKTDIASLSTGEERNFDFRNRDDHRKDIL
ncbi:MAG TPA: alpha-ketoglutarate-dependent dioxygenase AlkB, partial [Niabella sp.]|nr:alpha-ketoglutarate-dependent dioxygenase AlkB [Niabella sp.]